MPSSVDDENTNLTNRINATGYNYDANGNLTADNGTHTYGWDAEGKLVALGSNSQAYEALGRREKGRPDVSLLGSVAIHTGRAPADWL